MLFENVLLGFSLLHLVNSHLQINLHLTNWTTEDDNLQHDCLRVPAYIKKESDPHQIISYCMSTLPSKFKIKENNLDQKFTFEQLFKQKITSQQLYLWSAPIDVAEQYQSYLNQLSKSEKTSLATEIFYNCTLPYFGPQCQYVLQAYKSNHLSLDEIIHDYYRYNKYEPTLLTCYMHLKCNRGPSPACLDWTEICDGKVDCLDGDYDEEHCWQVEIHQCNENEYACSHGQCIPQSFQFDGSTVCDCLDQSDEPLNNRYNYDEDAYPVAEPTFKTEDVLCPKLLNRVWYLNSLTSSCVGDRPKLLSQAIFSIKPDSISNECWTAMKCIFDLSIQRGTICLTLCPDRACREFINQTCPNIIYVSAVPILFGHIYLAYDKNRWVFRRNLGYEPTYFCYNARLLYVPDVSEKISLSNNDTCSKYSDRRGTVINMRINFGWIRINIEPLYDWLRRTAISSDQNAKFLNNSMMYKCINWPKYISKHRLFDGITDCYYADDELTLNTNRTCSREQPWNSFKCVTTNECIPKKFVQDAHCDCTTYDNNKCDDRDIDYVYARNTVSFQTICDGYTHMKPQMIEGRNETDETNCEQWPSIHIYNHCDGFWHNPNGSDELNCHSFPLLNCPTNQHICVSPETKELMCLPIEKANDGIIDCLGAADEPTLCQKHLHDDYPLTFYCRQTDYYDCAEPRWICDNDQSCGNNEEEKACRDRDLIGVSRFEGICTRNYESDGSDVAKILCRRFSVIGRRLRIYFTLDQKQDSIKRSLKREITLPPIKENIEYYQQRCHRGLDLQVWLDKQKNRTINVCLCPPSYYGDICQYQNQRVSLTLQFGVTSDLVQTPLIIIISLIDNTDERIIHSYEQFTYLSFKHCQKKFNTYLLYSTRPKDETKNYSIHIDVYKKQNLDYRASFIRSLNFSFLPVHRVALQIDIPRIIDDCSDNQCLNGKCIKYFADPMNRTFCQCDKGWSGRYCTVPYTSLCSSDSLSLGRLTNNRSLCVCPANKMGPRCLMNDVICQHNRSVTCFNNGECIPIDEFGISTKNFLCICTKAFTGDQCEIARTKLIMTFDQTISLSSSILMHFIEVRLDDTPVRTTTFKTTSIGQSSVTVFWSLPFHIAFVELSNKTYYLVHVKSIYNQSAIIETSLNSSDRCLDINELFNETIIHLPLVRRIKSYHLPCQTRKSWELKCFYDEIHFCLCQQIDQQRVANCFEFDPHLNSNCSGQSGCENGGQCFQEQTTCPRVSVCQCPTCYYGARCQLSTSGFSLSLDAILGFHIRPNLNISHQPAAVLISLILTLIITLLGFTNGILLLITFQNKTTRESGCDLYLLSSSIITLLAIMVFFLKFLILLLSQMGSINNRSFLTIQCHSIDFLLRFSLIMDQWLTAFVAVERAFIVAKGIQFDKKKSKLTAKWIISGLVLITMITNIHDPIYRRLFIEDNNDDDERRLWCIVQYSSAIRIINLIINILHFIVPFIVNLISALVIIIMSTRQQAVIKKKQQYNDIRNEQIRQHKNLLIGPCVLIILGIPRLIISFTSGCMKSTIDSWLFLLGYFISLIPTLLTFILFVLPSSKYKEAFRKAVNRYRNLINQRS